MGKTSFEFINQQVPSFRKKINQRYIQFSNLLNAYRDHILYAAEDEYKTAEEFLAKEESLKSVLESAGCYEDAIHVMESFAKEL